MVKLLPDYLQQIDDCRAEIARLEGEKETFEQQTDDEEEESSEEGEEENDSNYAKVLEAQLKEVKQQLKVDKDNMGLLAEKDTWKKSWLLIKKSCRAEKCKENSQRSE